MPGAEGLGELSGQLGLGVIIMMRPGAGDHISWGPEAEVSVPKWPVAIVVNIVRSGNTRWLACNCNVLANQPPDDPAHSQRCGGYIRRWGNILRPLRWRDGIYCPLEAEAEVWCVFKAEGSVWPLLEVEVDIWWSL